MTSEKARCVKRNMEDISFEHPEFSQKKVLEKAFKKCKLMEENRG